MRFFSYGVHSPFFYAESVLRFVKVLDFFEKMVYNSSCGLYEPDSEYHCEGEKNMKKILMFTAASALLCACLTGCGVNSSGDSSSKAAGTQSSSQIAESSLDSDGGSSAADAQTTAASSQTESSTTSAAAKDALSDADMKTISKQLIQEYASIYDGMLSGSVTVDDTDVYNPEPAYTYYRVTDGKLQSISDVKAAMAKTVTGAEYDKLTGIAFGETIPMYMEREGKLYALSVGRGGAYSDTWRWDQLKFNHVTADSFTVTGEYSHMGDMLFSQTFDIVRTDDGFRISNASEVQINDNDAPAEDVNTSENPFDEYIGQWKSDTQWNGSDYYIQISRDREILNVEVTAHSAVADYQWDYSCICSEDGTYIECADGGVLNRTDYAPDGEKQEPVQVYNDGGAKFNIKGGTLFWSEYKEDTARQVGFSKIG